jgi:drug/metabolite transporter (DMT)-like permease
VVFLLLSVTCSVAIYLVLKWIGNKNVNLQGAITVNYLTCIVLGSYWLNEASFFRGGMWLETWVWKSTLLGMLFFFIFTCMGLTTRFFSVSVTAVSSKMAMVIPAIFFVITRSQFPEWKLILGLFGGVISVMLLTMGPQINGNNRRYAVLPFIVWVGSGIIDILLVFLESEAKGIDHGHIMVSTCIFSGAFVSGLLWHGIRSWKKGTPVFSGWKQVPYVWGIWLGLPNFGSIVFLLKAISVTALSEAVLFPVNHIGIVLLSVLLSVVLFGERFTRQRKWGLILALTSLVLLVLTTQN